MVVMKCPIDSVLYLSCPFQRLFPGTINEMCTYPNYIAFAGRQLELLADVLDEEGVFTDYTDTNGVWRTVKDNGKSIGKTVWTR